MSQIIQQQDMIIEEMKLKSAMRDRKIYFNEEVTRDSVFKIVHLLDKIVKLDKEENKKDDIEIILDCEGGDIYSGLSLASKIIHLKEVGYKVNITVNSIAMSMAFLFVAIGSKRSAYKYATLMIHQPNAGTWGRLQDIQEDVDEFCRTWDLYKKIIKENTKITDVELERLKKEKRDWYMDAETALKYGVIDEII